MILQDFLRMPSREALDQDLAEVLLRRYYPGLGEMIEKVRA